MRPAQKRCLNCQKVALEINPVNRDNLASSNAEVVELVDTLS